MLHEVDKYYPELKVHLFGVTTLKYFKKYRLYSGDSSNAIQAGRMLSVYTPYLDVSFSKKVNTKYHYNNLSVKERTLVDKYLKSINLSADELGGDPAKCIKANMIYENNNLNSGGYINRTRLKNTPLI